MITYSVWVLPPPALTAAINRLHARCRETLGGPQIIPHITVAGGIDMPLDRFTSLVRQAAAGFTASEAKLEKVATAPHFFRSLFIEAEVSDRICALRRRIYALGETPEPDYHPHASLYYGDAVDTQKQAVAETLPALGSTCFSDQTLVIAFNNEVDLDWGIVEPVVLD